MAQEIIVRLLDDLDGSEAQSTVTFSVEGDTYEVDLSAQNRENFMKAIAPYMEVARVADSSPKRRPNRPNAKAVRAWARDNGIEVNPTGRVPQSVTDAYWRAQTH